MSLRLLLPLVCALGACVLTGCASVPGPKLLTCDGATPRPANPHGSILSQEPAPIAAVAVDIQTPPSGGCT